MKNPTDRSTANAMPDRAGSRFQGVGEGSADRSEVVRRAVMKRPFVVSSVAVVGAALGLGLAADYPFRDGEVDGPGGSLGEVALEFAGAEQGLADSFGERLGAGCEGDGVGADHPGAVGGELSAADGGESQDEAGDHGGAEHEPEDVQQVAGA